MVNIYAATTAIDIWNILDETNRYNIKYKIYINGEYKGDFITLIDDDHYGYYILFYYNNGGVSFKIVSDYAKIKLKRIKKSKLPI